MRVNPFLAPLLAAALGAAVLTTVPAARASAATGPIFTVINTTEIPPDGVWFRNSPHTADTDRVTGHGVYMNEQVQLHCYAWGDAVGAYNNSLWYYSLNVTRPTNAGLSNEGYLNAHYINDGLAANQIDAGVPECGAAPPPPPPVPIGNRVAYYSGLGSAGSPKANNLGVDRNLTYDGSYDGRWKPGVSCVPDSNAIKFASKDINRLAGWSVGRLGPIYALRYLKDHNPEAARRINYVVMFDPGAPSSFDKCDYNRTTVQADTTLAWWLGLSDSNRLIIMSGKPTATNHHETIQNAYFPAIKQAGTGVRTRVLVCNYGLDHNATYNNYAYLMTASYRLSTAQGFSSCPKQGSAAVWGWNP